ncbi:YcaO-like family protein [Amycolatopsis sp. PS_44_ISF1]|uniref:YcaO-like family protein n=1 Tax=Amycolatopsis sp. PS_44_ISF1 TaxID=2974917 RepID=UPI0028DEC0C7|nr:YcaO-like family protein [Amycolatopsis sp. PS_44_ISF1]MDT8913108.1 YcaO-like family protein [Amycolatopsis sp. PS_44_ISF1]
MTAGRKVFFTGTHRVRRPEDTWAAVEPLLPRYGITRIADVTGLDVLGIPVMMAVRPLARSLTVSQGKGHTPLLARISAAMESIELWHAENVPLDPVHRATPARELGLPYEIAGIVTDEGSLVTERTPLDWVAATDTHSGRPAPVPWPMVGLPHQVRPWDPPGFLWSTNGLASGNSRAEAALHAIYEVIERDALSRIPRGAPWQYLDPGSLDDDVCAPLIDRIRAGGATVRITTVDSRFGVPCFAARVWSQDFPVACGGWGTHLDPHVALSRALTEAVQSRLTGIAGSRDDLPAVYERVRVSTEDLTPAPGPTRAWAGSEPPGPGAFDDVEAELAWLSKRVHEVTGTGPLLADLSTTGEFSVVKVLLARTLFDAEYLHTQQ